jgi:tripartite-type tricarboxylate transporter receptor subunit TctC
MRALRLRSGALARALAGFLLAGGVVAVHAQAYPSQPIRILVEGPPGNSADISARRIAQRLSDTLSQPVVVDNRPGASGSVAAEAVAKARPDGYTLLYGGMTSLVYFPAAGGLVRYDARKDFTPVALGTLGYPVVVANPALGIKSVSDLLKYARIHATEVTCATGGPASVQHFICAEFARVVGVPMRYVPYRGSTAALTDTAAGQTELSIAFTSELDALVGAGRLVALATLSPRRSLKYPAVATLREAGFEAIEFPAFTGIFAPAGTPQDIVERLNVHVIKALAHPDMTDWLRTVNGSTLPLDAAHFTEYFHKELDRAVRIAKDSGIRSN